MADDLTDAIAADADAARDPEPDRQAGRRAQRERTTSSSSSKSSGRKRTKTTGRKKSLRKDLEAVLGLIGTGLSAVDPFDGAVVLANAETTAKKLDDLAQENDAIYRVLSVVTAGQSGPLALLSALAPIALPILWRHGALPSHPLVNMTALAYVPNEALSLLPFDPAAAPDGDGVDLGQPFQYGPAEDTGPAGPPPAGGAAGSEG